MSFKSKACVVALAGALLAGLPATAFAATDYKSGFNSSADLVSKVWQDDDAAHYTIQNFTFVMTYQSVEPVGTYPTPSAPETTEATVTLTAKDSDGVAVPWTKSTTVTASVNDLLSQLTFTAPGVYNFTLSESDVSNKDIKKDPSVYTVKVQVVSKVDATGAPVAGVEIQSVKVLNEDGSKTGNDVAAFSNTAADSGNLTITKVLKGNAADPDEVFEFTVNLNSVGVGSYSVVYSGALQDTNPGTITNGSKVYLKRGESLQITNLPAGASYEVIETNSKGYEVEYSYTDDSKTIESGDNDTVTVTNEMNASPLLPTGLMMDIAPYAVVIGIVVVAGAAYIVSRKRRANDQF